MVPIILKASLYLIASLQGDGTGLRAEKFGCEFTLFPYHSKEKRQQLTIQRYLIKIYLISEIYARIIRLKISN